MNLLDEGDASSPLLLRAAADGDLESLCELLDGGADMEQVDGEVRTALMKAAELGHAQIVSELLERGAAVDRADKYGNTALLLGALSGSAATVRSLLRWDAEIDHTNRRGQTALFLAASCPVHPDPVTPGSRHEGHDDVMRILLAQFANTEYYEIGGLQPVSAAAQNGNVVATLELLEAGARFLSDEIVGPNLLCSVAEKGNLEAVRLLLDRGAEFFYINDTRGHRTALNCAASARQYSVVKELLDRGAIVRGADHRLFDDWIEWLEAEAEAAYDRMYDSVSVSPAGDYSSAKDYLSDAIGLSRRIGRMETATKLEARLDHIKSVFRSQFR